MSRRSLRIAWLGPAPGGHGGVRGVAADLLKGLAREGHRIDCFLPAAEGPSIAEIVEEERVALGEENPAFAENVTLVRGASRWQWKRWYSRGRIAALASGLLARGAASLLLRREIARRHRRQPYDLIYQFSSIETPGVPARLAREVPLVIQPETHIAGELRWLLAERELALRCQPRPVFAAVTALMFVRARIQRHAIRRARLLVCISGVFRDHLVRDYGFPRERTVVVPNPVHIARFATAAQRDGRLGEPPVVLVLGRISARKGIDDVVAVAKTLLERDVHARVRVIGGPSLWSDYTKLLGDLPAANAEYAGHIPADEVPAELVRADVLLQASKYEPFGLTVGEALAAGTPVLATSEVGAAEGVDPAVLTVLEPGDVEGMVSAISQMLERLHSEPAELRSGARSEAERLFAPDVVCTQISAALERLLDGPPSERSERSRRVEDPQKNLDDRAVA
jgi:glycosyltransferase involved in cell wall biosynthesis